jgi:hypothetical protein
MSARLTLAVFSLGILLAAAIPVAAHHSFSATYDSNKPITLTGKISKLGWNNPHAHLFVDVAGRDAKVTTWEVETGGASALLRQGIRREDLIGTEVLVTGFLAKDGSPSLVATKFTLAESKKQFLSEEVSQ